MWFLTDTHLKALKYKPVFFQEAKFAVTYWTERTEITCSELLRSEKAQAQGLLSAGTPEGGLCCTNPLGAACWNCFSAHGFRNTAVSYYYETNWLGHKASGGSSSRGWEVWWRFHTSTHWGSALFTVYFMLRGRCWKRELAPKITLELITCITRHGQREDGLGFLRCPKKQQGLRAHETRGRSAAVFWCRKLLQALGRQMGLWTFHQEQPDLAATAVWRVRCAGSWTSPNLSGNHSSRGKN